MPWSANDPPDAFKNMPKEAMTIALSAANSHIKDNPKEEVNAIKICIAAVKNAGWLLDKDTGWVKNDMGIYSIVENCVANANRIGEDQHFIHYKVTVTSPGIHNDRYKPPETITKILRAQEVAMRCRIPIIYLVDSAGVNLPYQGGVFPGQYGAARIFYYNSLMRRYLGIPQI